jgi:hypothetical protein
MENFIKNYLILILFFGVMGCGATVKSVSSSNLKLRNFNNIYLVLVDATGATSLSAAGLGGSSSALLSGHKYDGAGQGKQSLQNLQFELMSMGFSIVGDKNKADIIVEFSIGQIRYDPITGWIADQGIVRFIDRNSGAITAMYKAKPRFITPTTNTIVKMLAREIKQNY